MKNAIPLEVYIAYNNPVEAQALIVRHGSRPAKNHNDLVKRLNLLLKANKDEALKELAKIHPDKDMIMHYEEVDESASNACGCSGADGESKCGCNGKKSGAEGDASKAAAKPPISATHVWDSVKPYAPVLIGATFFVVGLCIFVKRA